MDVYIQSYDALIVCKMCYQSLLGSPEGQKDSSIFVFKNLQIFITSRIILSKTIRRVVL